MPIIFRCTSCNQKLSASDRKAGKSITCPACGFEFTVPIPEGVESVEAADEQYPVESPEETPPSPPPEFSEPVSEQFSESPLPTQRETVFEPEPPSSQAPPAHPRVEDHDDEDEGFVLRKADTESEGMDLTPMVDVTFLLLIFFMITASFSIQKTITVPPPDPDQEGPAPDVVPLDEQERVSIEIVIDAKNAITVDDDPLPDPSGLDEKIQSIMRSEQKRELLLFAHPDSFHETLILVIDAANEARIQKIQVVMQE